MFEAEELYRSPNALAAHYTRFRVAERLLLTGHSHQAWPDRAFEGQCRAWLDAADPRGAGAPAQVDAVRLLDGFKPEDAAMLRLRYAEDWRIHEIAGLFGASQRSVRRRLERIERRARAVVRLKEVA